MIVSERRVPYVQSAGSQDVPPPYHFPGVTVHAFIWEAQMQPIQDYCDRFFNLGPAAERGFVYKPAPFWPYATLLFLEYPEMISANAHEQDTGEVPYCERGVTSQSEVFVALPVMRYGTTPTGFITDSELEWVLPFITVSEPWSCVCGREMLGLGKLLADIDIGEGKYPQSFKGSVTLPGWLEERSGVMQGKYPLLEVATGPTLPTFRAVDQERSLATLLQSRELGWLADNAAALANFVDTASLGLLPTTMRSVGLKQYRDALDPERAIYQALVTCRSQYSNVSGFKFYDEKDVRIGFSDIGSFHEILQTLLAVEGSPTGADVPVDAVAAFRFQADINYDLMRVIHQFPLDGAPGQAPSPMRSDLVARWFRPWQGFFGPRQPA